VQAPYLADGVPKLHTFNVIHLQIPVISRIEPSIKSISCKQPSPIVCRVGSKWVNVGQGRWVNVGHNGSRAMGQRGSKWVKVGQSGSRAVGQRGSKWVKGGGSTWVKGGGSTWVKVSLGGRSKENHRINKCSDEE
jgi:hypothetical protein